MRSGFEFTFHLVDAHAVPGGADTTLALLGSLGWELRGLTARPDGSIVAALQRPLHEDHPLPDASVLAATLDEPLAAPALAGSGEA